MYLYIRLCNSKLFVCAKTLTDTEFTTDSRFLLKVMQCFKCNETCIYTDTFCISLGMRPFTSLLQTHTNTLHCQMGFGLECWNWTRDEVLVGTFYSATCSYKADAQCRFLLHFYTSFLHGITFLILSLILSSCFIFHEWYREEEMKRDSAGFNSE